MLVGCTRGYDFSIHYKPSATDVGAHILSRLEKAKDVSCDHISAFIEGKDPLIQNVNVSLEVEYGSVQSNIDWAALQQQDCDFKELMRLVKSGEGCRSAEFPHKLSLIILSEAEDVFYQVWDLMKDRSMNS